MKLTQGSATAASATSWPAKESREVVRKYRDAATIFMLTVLLPDGFLKSQDRLATNNSQAMGQANRSPVPPFCGGGGMTGWQSRREAMYQLENYHERKPKHYHKNMKTRGKKKKFL